jgi:hypothetical protein
MVTEKKRKLEAIDAPCLQNRAKTPAGKTPVRRDLLERCYGRVNTLREYVLSKLPQGSRLRRKKVASIGQGDDIGEIENNLSRLLDTSLVCFVDKQCDADDTRWEQWLVFSQREDESYVSLSDGIAGSIYSQNEVSILFLTERNHYLPPLRLWILLCGCSSQGIYKLDVDLNICYVTASENQPARMTKERPVYRVFSACIPTLMSRHLGKPLGPSCWRFLANLARKS